MNEGNKGNVLFYHHLNWRELPEPSPRPLSLSNQCVIKSPWEGHQILHMWFPVSRGGCMYAEGPLLDLWKQTYIDCMSLFWQDSEEHLPSATYSHPNQSVLPYPQEGEALTGLAEEGWVGETHRVVCIWKISCVQLCYLSTSLWWCWML